MKRISELLTLEKESNVKIQYCDIIADRTNETDNIRIRILHDPKSGKYYYHKMQNGEIVKCFEIAISWQPSQNYSIFAFTPDDMHVYELDQRTPEKIEIRSLQENQIEIGMKCEYDGMTVEYESENKIKINGKSLEVIPDYGYVFKLLKTRIRAQGGAKGLYRFLENIAAKGNHGEFGEDTQIGGYTLMDFDKSYWLRFKKLYAE